MSYYKNIAYCDFTMEKLKVQKEKSILPILLERLKTCKRRVTDVVKGQLFSQRKPTILH